MTLSLIAIERIFALSGLNAVQVRAVGARHSP